MKKLIFVLCLLLIPISVFGYTGTGSTTTGTTTDLSIPDIVNLGFDRTNGAWYIVFIGSQDVIAYQGGVWDVTSLLLPATFYLINSDGNILQINSRGELMGDTTAHIKNLPTDYPDAAVLGQLQAGTTVQNFNYVGKVSSGSMGLISGGGIQTVSITGDIDAWSFTFRGTSGTFQSNFRDGTQTLRNGADYESDIFPLLLTNPSFTWGISDDGTVDWDVDRVK